MRGEMRQSSIDGRESPIAKSPFDTKGNSGLKDDNEQLEDGKRPNDASSSSSDGDGGSRCSKGEQQNDQQPTKVPAKRGRKPMPLDKYKKESDARIQLLREKIEQETDPNEKGRLKA